MKKTIEQKNTTITHESPADEHRSRSERIAAQGVRLGKANYLIPLVGLAVLAGMAFAQA
ncbi:hypothetical protein ACFFKC_02425 [Pseudoduganella danionis]|uniref:hypothetical protein n=1 Tax=Pseudoduganella danionis TaxID=1890295 RepID=UPI0018B01F6D|nr:hypothetical protein [Pseudoduganella danionis]